MSTVANLFVYVKAGTGTDKAVLRTSIIEKSKATGFTDRIFFLEDSAEIVTRGAVFGLSTSVADNIKTAQAAILGLEGAVASATGFVKSIDENGVVSYTSEITDDSVIAKYVAEKIAASAVTIDNSDTITAEKATDDKGTTTYALHVQSSALVDGKTLTVADNKISTSINLVYEPASDTNDKKPSMYLIDNEGTIVSSKIDVTDFIKDGMIEKVAYNAETGYITITWNSDSDVDDKETSFSVKDFFSVVEVHVEDNSKSYVSVTKGDSATVEGGVDYEVKALVDSTDLTAAETIIKTAADPAHNVEAAWAVKQTADAKANNYDEIGKDGKIADVTKVAAKFTAVDKDIVEVANIALQNERDIAAASTAVDEKIAALKKALYGKDIEADETPANTISSNKDAIDTLNGDDTVAGSVDAKIKALKESLKKTAKETADVNSLVTVTLSEDDGIASVDAVDVKVDRLTFDATSIDGIKDLPYVQMVEEDGTTKYYAAKTFETIQANNPALVTTQDAWLYGQAILAKSIASIKSNNNKFIKIDYDSLGKTSNIVFEPWTDVTSVDDLNNLDK